MSSLNLRASDLLRILAPDQLDLLFSSRVGSMGSILSKGSPLGSCLFLAELGLCFWTWLWTKIGLKASRFRLTQGPAGPTASGLNNGLPSLPTREAYSKLSSFAILSGTYLNSSSTKGLEFLLTALWRRPISNIADLNKGCSLAPILPSRRRSRSFFTTAHQAWSAENCIIHLNRVKANGWEFWSQCPSLDFNWLLWRSQPNSCIKSMANFLLSVFTPRQSVSGNSISLSSIRISEQTSFSATIKGKKLLLRPRSSSWMVKIYQE